MFDNLIQNISNFIMTGKNTTPPKIVEKINQQTNELLQEIDEQILYHLEEIRKPNNTDINNNHWQQIDELVESKKKLRNILESDSIINIINKFINENPDASNTSLINYDKNESLIANTTRYLRLLRNSTQSLEKQYSVSNQTNSNKIDEINRINDPALGLELFRTYRSMIEHENKLLSERITWFLVANAFLFAAFGTAISIEETNLFTIIVLGAISITGIAYSSLVLNPITLALLAIDTIKNEWRNRSEIDNPNIDEFYNNLLTPQVKKILPKQVCFDAEEKVFNTRTILLEEYFPKYYGGNNQRKSSGYHVNIKFIIWTTIIIWSVLLVSVVMKPFDVDNKFLHPRYLLTITYPEGESNLKSREFKKIIDEDNQNNQTKFQLNTTVCLNPIKSDNKDNYEEVLAITQKDNPSFVLSKRQYNYTKNLLEDNLKKIQKQQEENSSQLDKNSQVKSTNKPNPPTNETDPTIDYSKIVVREPKIQAKKSTICP